MSVSSTLPFLSVHRLHQQLQAKEKIVLVDVREPWETDLCLIPGSLKIPLASLPQKYRELPSDSPLVMICHRGGRSAKATAWLLQQGFTQVYNLEGGVAAWAAHIDPKMRTYE